MRRSRICAPPRSSPRSTTDSPHAGDAVCKIDSARGLPSGASVRARQRESRRSPQTSCQPPHGGIFRCPSVATRSNSLHEGRGQPSRRTRPGCPHAGAGRVLLRRIPGASRPFRDSSAACRSRPQAWLVPEPEPGCCSVAAPALSSTLRFWTGSGSRRAGTSRTRAPERKRVLDCAAVSSLLVAKRGSHATMRFVAVPIVG